MLNFSYAYAIARLSCKNKKTISVVCCSDRNAQKLTEILQILIGSTKNIAYLPSPQTLLYEKLEPSANITASRLSVLFAWQMQKVDIIVIYIVL